MSFGSFNGSFPVSRFSQDHALNFERRIAMVNDRRRREDFDWENRALFATLSKGYPLTPDQIAEFFNTRYGYVVVKVRMCRENPEYAFVVLNSPVAVDRILNRQETAKFKVKGCHLWVRKYVASHVWVNRRASQGPVRPSFVGTSRGVLPFRPTIQREETAFRWDHLMVYMMHVHRISNNLLNQRRN